MSHPNGWGTYTTTDGSANTLHQILTATGDTLTVLAVIGARSGSNGAGYGILGTFKNISGSLIQVGTTTALHTAEDAGLTACSVAFSVSGANLLVQVTGIAATTIEWTGGVLLSTVA